MLIGRWRSAVSRYEDTISLLQEARSSSIAVEQRHNFGKRRRPSRIDIGKSKQAKIANSWSHKFICLAYTDQDKSCSSTPEKTELILAGLGEKNITINDVDCSPKEFRDCITAAFPKLAAGGGFEYLKCAPSTRKLEVIPFHICNSVRRLRAWIGNAKVYLRPIQMNLDLTASEELNGHNEVRIWQ